jgi:winged helix-turn-helix protein
LREVYDSSSFFCLISTSVRKGFVSIDFVSIDSKFQFGAGRFGFFGFDFGFVCGWFCFGGNGDRLCIVAAILDAANSCASKTRILLGANLNFSFLKKCLHAF